MILNFWIEWALQRVVGLVCTCSLAWCACYLYLVDTVVISSCNRDMDHVGRGRVWDHTTSSSCWPDRLLCFRDWVPTQKLRSPLLRTQSYQRFSLSSLSRSEYGCTCSVYCQEFYVSNFCLPVSFNFIFLNRLQSDFVM